MITPRKKKYNQLILGMSSLFSIKTCKRFSGAKFIAPFYHSVSDIELPHIKPIYEVRSEQQFRNDLMELRTQFEFVDAEQFKKSLESNSPKSVALLSFDDGLKQCHSVIRPILNELSIPACFFINKDFVGGKEVFYRYKVGTIISELQKRKVSPDKIHEAISLLKGKNAFVISLEQSVLNLGSVDESILNELIRLLNITNWEKDIYMNENEIRELVNDGFNLGGHSVNHRKFSDMTDSEMLNQIIESVDYCQDNYGESMRLFAFPFFDYDMQLPIFKSMFSEGKIDMSFGTSGLKKDVFDCSVQRLDMEDNSTDSKTFLKNALFTQGIRRIVGNDKMRRSK